MIDRFVDVPNGYFYSRTQGAGPDVVSTPKEFERSLRELLG